MTCSNNINQFIRRGRVDEIPRLYPNTKTQFLITTRQRKLFQFSMSRQEVIRFLTELVFVGPSGSVDMTISIFSYDPANSSIRNLGSIMITELSQTFQKDLPAGDYFICISNGNITFNVALTGLFTDAPRWADIRAVQTAGSQMTLSQLATQRKETPCRFPIFHEIVDGNLPPGLILLSNGDIVGTLPNLDCPEENKTLSPSVNWFGEHGEDEVHPWSRQWRFKVRATIPQFEQAFDEKWLCIRVYNDWSIDQANLLSQLPFSKDHIVRRKHEEPYSPLNSLCVPCNNPITTPKIVPKLKSLCPECVPAEPTPTPPYHQPTVETEFEMVKSHRGVNSSNVIGWYQKYQNKTNLTQDQQKLLDEINESTIFRNLLVKKGLLPSITRYIKELKKVKIVLSDTTDHRILLIQSKLIDNRSKNDIDQVFLDESYELNQSLFIETRVWTGDVSVEIQFDSTKEN